MSALKWVAALAVALCACGGSGAVAPIDDAAAAPAASAATPATRPPALDCCAALPPGPVEPSAPLEVKWLGVDGFMISWGSEAVLTAPLYTRPSMFTVETGLPVKSDAALVAEKLPADVLAPVRAVIAGHAHYDHLLDVPAVLQRAPAASLFSNVSARSLLAAWAPDRAASCSGTPAQSPTIARSRVVAMDDPLLGAVDWRNCADAKPEGVPLEGKWISVPGSHLRVYAVCSNHPDQVGPYHFGPGDVTEEQCTPPTKMADWKEGTTIAFLIDFLDPKSGAPVYRVYYQDAPATAPVSQVPADVLADKRVDLALLCVGSSNNVDGEPAGILSAMKPRFAIGGHWEDFFRGADEQPQAITFLDTDAWTQDALGAMPAELGTEWTVAGAKTATRVSLPQPGDGFEVPGHQ